MLISMLLSLVVAAGSDSVQVTVAIHSARKDASPVSWMLTDSAGALLENGRTPSELTLTLRSAPKILCAESGDDWIAAVVEVRSIMKHLVIRGTGRCLQLRFAGGQVSLDGVMPPHVGAKGAPPPASPISTSDASPVQQEAASGSLLGMCRVARCAPRSRFGPDPANTATLHRSTAS